MKIKALLYCTKAKPYLVQGVAKPMHTLDATNPFNFNWKLVKKGFSNDRLNGKIVAECDYEVETYLTEKSWFDQNLRVVNKKVCDGVAKYSGTEYMLNSVLNKSCLTIKELTNYMNFENDIIEQKELYAIHIKNLKIFDKPKELSEYYSNLQRWVDIKAPTIKKAPQNMCYAFDDDLQPYIIISIKPEWLCKILNGEKTIEVRKKVLKEMINNE